MNSDGITLWPYPDIESQDPLPAGRTAERLRQDGAEDVARSVVEWNRDSAYRERMAAYRRCTLVIRWDRVPGACWALNMPEGTVTCQSRPERRIPARGGIQPWNFTWEKRGDRSCSIHYESPEPAASLECRFDAGPDRVDYRLTMRVDEGPPWPDLYCHCCFNHCWAEGFGRDAFVLHQDRLTPLHAIPNPGRIWIRSVTLAEEEHEAELKRRAVARLGREAPNEKIPLHGAQAKFIATERGGDDPLTVAISSPFATAVSWSYWPCTDIDLSFGTVMPSVPTTISGTIRFVRGRLADVVDELREPALTTPANRGPAASGRLRRSTAG